MGPEEVAEVSGAGGVLGDSSDNDTDITGTFEDRSIAEDLFGGGADVEMGGWGEAELTIHDIAVDGPLQSLTHLPAAFISRSGSPVTEISDLDLPLSENSIEVQQNSEPDLMFDDPGILGTEPGPISEHLRGRVHLRPPPTISEGIQGRITFFEEAFKTHRQRQSSRSPRRAAELDRTYSSNHVPLRGEVPGHSTKDQNFNVDHDITNSSLIIDGGEADVITYDSVMWDCAVARQDGCVDGGAGADDSIYMSATPSSVAGRPSLLGKRGGDAELGLARKGTKGRVAAELVECSSACAAGDGLG